MEYYAGVTPLFQNLQFPDKVLHYFDNFPTAAVETRAARLKSYLLKRIARNEFAVGDEVTLVGHSTGGLDIRLLLRNLHGSIEQTARVDGGAKADTERLRKFIRRVVFLSVPHRGTNIANWVRSYPVIRQAFVAELELAVAGSQLPLLDRIEEWVAGGAADISETDLLRALRDALNEADARIGPQDPLHTAEAHESAACLALYLRHMASNFRAIDDLEAGVSDSTANSPAHLPPPDQAAEAEKWKGLGIEILTIATIGDPPSDSAATDLTYRIAYSRCAEGPFERPSWKIRVARRIHDAPERPLTPADNDGIVNTLSMFWPYGDNLLVAGDHMDVVGHYEPGCRRYDLLNSGMKFDAKVFREVWSTIFRFC